jgi:uncharacterized protein (DUF2147 family)
LGFHLLSIAGGWAMPDRPQKITFAEMRDDGREGRQGGPYEPCGPNLCGYSVDAKTNLNGEKVLINMKPAQGLKWTGRIYVSVTRGSPVPGLDLRGMLWIARSG